MKRNTSLLLKKIVWVCGLVYSLAFLICCLTPFAEPDHFLFFTYSAILFPYCFLGYLLWLVTVFIFFRKRVWIFLLLLLFSWKNAGVVFAIHPPKEFVYKKDPKQLRVLSWNVNGLLYSLSVTDKRAFDEKQAAMMQFIKTSDADVLCFQDYVEAAWAVGKANIAYMTDSLKYPYHYFSDDFENYGTIIFSRLPILDTGHILYETKTKYPESLAFATIGFGGDSLRLYNTHLHSMFLHSDSLKPYSVGYLPFVVADTGYLFHTDRLERMAYYDRLHTAQAKLIKHQLNKTTTPFIFCADLNSVPSGYVYHHIKEGLQDAFLQKGSGLGGTYHRFTFSLRIDVVMMSKELKATQYFSPRPDLSDHYPIITDIELRK